VFDIMVPEFLVFKPFLKFLPLDVQLTCGP
jgi:hypothetical protein